MIYDYTFFVNSHGNTWKYTVFLEKKILSNFKKLLFLIGIIGIPITLLFLFMSHFDFFFKSNSFIILLY